MSKSSPAKNASNTAPPAKPPATEGEPPAKRRVTPLEKGRFHFAENARNTWRVVLDRKADYEDIFDVGFWVHIETSLNAGDLVEVLNDDNTLFVLLYVRKHARASHIEFVELIKRDLAADQHIEREGWRVEYRGPQLRWCVIDPSNAIRREGMHNADVAVLALNGFTISNVVQQPRIIG